MAKEKTQETTYKATHLRDEMYRLDTYGYGRSPAGKPVQILVKSEKLIISVAKQRLVSLQASVKQAKVILAAIKAAPKVKKKAK